jgi:hypothetical protein
VARGGSTDLTHGEEQGILTALATLAGARSSHLPVSWLDLSSCTVAIHYHIAVALADGGAELKELD